MPIRVQVGNQIVEFPDGTPEEEMLAALSQLPDPVASHEPQATPEARPIATGGGRGTSLDVRKSDRWASDNAPAIGGSIGALATGGVSIPLSMLGAAAGGAVGSGLRGDDLGTMATEGATQGAIEGAGGYAVKGLRKIAHGLMRGTVPKNIAKDYDTVDIAGTMLERGAVPGSARSARRIEGLSRIANAERTAAASSVPRINAVATVGDVRPIYQQAKLAKEPGRAADILAYAKQTVKDIGPSGLDGPAQLARKDIKQKVGKAAINDPRTAAFLPQLADAERSALVANMRSSPRMASALDESQKMMALDDVMKDAAHSNIVTRGRIGGLPAMAMTPLGLSMSAHAANQGARAVDPNVIRALLALLQERSGQ